MGKHKKVSRKHKKTQRPKKKSTNSSEEEWVEAESMPGTEGTKKTLKDSSPKSYSRSLGTSKEDKVVERRTSRRNSSGSSCSSDKDDSKRYSHHTSSHKQRSKRRYSRSSSVSTDEEMCTKVRNKNKCIESATTDESRNKYIILNTQQATSKREDWMDMSTSFSSISNIDRKNKKEQDKTLQKISERYNPRECSRELNPYWKNGGDGLPKFKKPEENNSCEESSYKYKRSGYVKSESNWKKRMVDSCDSLESKNVTSSSQNTKIDIEGSGTEKFYSNISEEKPITEKELNLLAGKLVKAEIMGNEKLAKDLREKLENARKSLEEGKPEDEKVLLTQTDRQGHSKPLTLQSDYREHPGKQKRKKAIETHQDRQRIRYFPDDDKYSLKQMFEQEKFNTVNNQDSEFLRIASKIRKNDNLDDLFSDDIRRKQSDSKVDDANRNKAIKQHQKMTESLDICYRCIQSNSMQKHLIISMGEYVYLSLPPHEPLTDGHCLIVPIRHVACTTQLDENEWAEILDFRKSLLKLYQKKDEVAVFFECTVDFYKYPHMVLECVPLPKHTGEMAPIYFKKAIDESEHEWAQNKKLVSLKGRDVRKAIPKGLRYFFVSFGLEEGYAHVIEDEKLFPRNFAQEIIGGMLDLHHSKWRKPGKHSFTDQSKRVLQFSDQWKQFDCTVKN